MHQDLKIRVLTFYYYTLGIDIDLDIEKDKVAFTEPYERKQLNSFISK
jgi:hypothetical protein